MKNNTFKKVYYLLSILLILIGCGKDSSKSKDKNQAPIVNAGIDRTVNVNETITITGRASDSDGDIESYTWKNKDKILASTLSFSYTPTIVGIDDLTLIVIDNNGDSTSDIMRLTVKEVFNKVPVANAGFDENSKVNSSVILKGSGKDSDGTITEYEWIKDDVVLGTNATLEYKPKVEGNHILTFTVTDNDGDSGSDTITISVAKVSTKNITKIINWKKSIEPIKELYFKVENQTSWGKNLLNNKLPINSQIDYTIDDCNKNYDIKAIYENNKDISYKEIDLKCEKENKIFFTLYRSTIPEENIDCSIKGKNKMLYDIMKDTYLWYKETATLDYALFSNLNTLLDDLTYKEYDKWSYITTIKEYTQYNEEGTYLGYGYSLSLNNDNIAFIKYVYKNSSADKGGLKRGTEILSINGKTIKQINDEQLWSTIMGKDEIGLKLNLEVKMGSNIKKIIITKDIVKINAVLTDKILNIDGKKIGYLIFQNFIEPSRDELKTVFSKFKRENIDELILDLRYNGGGRLNIAQYIASLISGDNTIDKIFNELQYNDKFSYWNYKYKFIQEEYSLGLNRVYIISSSNTASASEFLISGLKPFLDVYLIGSKTRGKPVGMNGYNFCKKRIVPIMFKWVNANDYGDYFDGIPITCSSQDNPLYAFGTLDEWMLKETLYFIKNKECSTSKQEKMMKSKIDIETNNELYQGFRGEIGAF